MKVLANLNAQAKDNLKKKEKAKPGKIYVDGETLTKKKKNVLNPNIERRKVIHLHAETHRLDDPDYRVVATNDVEEEFRMEDFDEATDQHYLCKPSAAVQ